MTHLTYTVLLIPDPVEGGFTVTVPWLPGCITEGDTVENALAMAREAITLHVETLAEDGVSIPVELSVPCLANVEVDVQALVRT